MISSLSTVTRFISTAPSHKELLRLELKKIRKEIPEWRRNAASEAFYTYFSYLLKEGQQERILSFSSLAQELDVSKWNQELAKQGRLILPRVEKQRQLSLYRVLDIERTCSPGSFGILEPDPDLCEQVSPQDVNISIVPGLGFDLKCNRVGYGGGYYDRLLQKIISNYQKPNYARIFGVGFKEQFVQQEIDRGPHDIPVEILALF